MGRRKNYPWDMRADRQMTNLVSGLLTGLIFAPFAIADSVPNSSDLNTEPVSKPVAIIFLIIGIALVPLFIPLISLAFEALGVVILGPFIFIALIFIPLVVWGGILYTVIEAFSTNKKNNKTNKSKVSTSIYQKLVLNLSKDIKIANDIRTDLDSVIKPNVQIEQKIERLNNAIDKYKRKLKINGFIPSVKSECFSKIKATYREIHFLKTFNKVSASTDEINGYVFLAINFIASAGKSINIDKLEQKRKDKQLFYSINKEPSISLLFKSIELYFFDDAVAFMTEDAYIVIDKKSVFVEYSPIPLDVSIANKDVAQFNIVDTSCRQFCNDGILDMRYYHRWLIELGVLELNIASQKVSLLFSNVESGSKLYFHLIHHLGYSEKTKTRICHH